MNPFKLVFIQIAPIQTRQPGAIARSVAMSLGNQEATRSFLASGTSFREDLVMKIYFSTILTPPLIQEEHLSVNGENVCIKYWQPASGRLAQDSKDRISNLLT